MLFYGTICPPVMIRNSARSYTDSHNNFSPFALFDWHNMVIIRFSPSRFLAGVCFCSIKLLVDVLIKNTAMLLVESETCCSLSQDQEKMLRLIACNRI